MSQERKSHRKMVTVRMDPSQHRELVYQAWRHGISLNEYCVIVLEGGELPRPLVPDVRPPLATTVPGPPGGEA